MAGVKVLYIPEMEVGNALLHWDALDDKKEKRKKKVGVKNIYNQVKGASHGSPRPKKKKYNIV